MDAKLMFLLLKSKSGSDYWLVFSLVIILFCTEAQGQCPSGEDCTVIKSCPAMLKLLSQNPLPPRDVERARNSQCGYDHYENQPKVCCPRPVQRFTDNELNDSKCGTAFYTPRIVYGKETTLGEYPWLALLQYQTPNGTNLFSCSGSLINRRYVLTTAHCVMFVPKGWKLIGVRLGEHVTDTDLDCEGEDSFKVCANPALDVLIESVTVHPYFNATVTFQKNDIALIKLKEDVLYSEWVQPICLPDTEVSIRNITGAHMTVAGFGTSYDTQKQRNAKRKTNVYISPHEVCREVYKNRKVLITEDDLCVEEKNSRNSCITDSGSPLMKLHTTTKGSLWYLHGVAAVETLCHMDYLGIYTNISTHIPWIKDNLKF